MNLQKSTSEYLSEAIGYQISLPKEQEEKLLELAKRNEFSSLEFRFVNTRMKKGYWLGKPANSLEDVFYFRTPSFSLIEKYYSTDKAKLIIATIISHYYSSEEAVFPSHSLDLSNSDVQIIANHIITPYDKRTSTGGFPGMEIQDLKLMFMMGIRGEFGKPYGKYTLAEITGKDGWVDQYFNKRKNYVKEQNINREEIVEEVVPMPAWLKQKWAESERENKLKVAKEAIERKPTKFTSVAEYCRYNGYSYKRFMTFFINTEYKGGLPIREYIRIKEVALLYLINKKLQK